MQICLRASRRCGVGPKKLRDFGEAFLTAIREYGDGGVDDGA